MRADVRALPRRRRLTGVRLLYLGADGEPVTFVEFRLDGRGCAHAVIGRDTMAAATYGRGAAAPSRCYEGSVARALAAKYGFPIETDRLYGPEDGLQFLVCVLADNRPRMCTWGEAIEEDDGGVCEVEGT